MNSHDSIPVRKARRRFTLSVRALMLGMLLVGGSLGWWIHRTNVQRRAVATIERLGGAVDYDFKYRGGKRDLSGSLPRLQSWLWKRDLLDYFHCVVGAGLVSPSSSPFRSSDSEPPPLSPRERETLWACLEDLGGLKMLFVQSHRLNSIDLAHLERLSSLEELSLWDTNVGDAGLVRLSRLTNLRSLHIVCHQDDSPITDSGVAYVASLTHLRELKISSSGVTDASLIPLGRMQELRSLSLEGTQVNGGGLIHLAGLSELRELSLQLTSSADGSHSENDLGLASLARLVRLRKLDLSAADLTDRDLGALRGVTQLRDLSLRWSKVTDSGLMLLQPFTNLEKLDLSLTEISDAGLVHLRALPQLNALTISDTKTTHEGIVDLKARLPRLLVKSVRCGPFW